MSVILYDDKKFLKIYATLRLNAKDYAHIFGYPEGWDKPGGMDTHLRAFIDDLRRANVITWNRQYPDDPQPLTALEFKPVMPYSSDIQLLKSLQGLRYNLISNDGRITNLSSCFEKLTNLIYYLMSRIIDRLPEYQKAKTW